MKKLLKEIFGKLESDDWIFVGIPVVVLTPFVIAGFCSGNDDVALGVLIQEVFLVVLLILAPALHDKMYG